MGVLAFWDEGMDVGVRGDAVNEVGDDWCGGDDGEFLFGVCGGCCVILWRASEESGGAEEGEAGEECVSDVDVAEGV